MKFEKIIPGTLCADLSDSQKSAIIYSIELAKKIQTQFPTIAEEYRGGSSLSTICTNHRINELFGVKPKTAQEAVRIALGGYKGVFVMANIDSFPGMIPLEEFTKIGKSHNVANSTAIGIHYRDNGLGIFSISKKDRSKIGQKSAKIQMRQKIGIHAQTKKERRILGQKAIEAQGGTIYSKKEIAFIRKLTKDPLYKNHKSQVKVSAIADKVNEKFHENKPVRNGSKITKMIMRYKMIKKPTQQ
jgi:hypothetical protein